MRPNSWAGRRVQGHNTPLSPPFNPPPSPLPGLFSILTFAAMCTVPHPPLVTTPPPPPRSEVLSDPHPKVQAAATEALSEVRRG